MNNEPKISVIVPVYNAEQYLCRCIDSILSQTFTDFELLLIDDGSSDKSGDMCDGYAQKDSRVRVFHKENGGVSSARQCGIDIAQGEYIIHADSDDWVESSMLYDMYEEALKTNADIILCDYYIDSNRNSIVVRQAPSSCNAKDVLRDLFHTLHGSLCNKLIRISCYTEHGIYFPKDMSLCEDLFVVCSMLKNDIKVSYIPQAYYHYVQDANDFSITKVVNSSYEYDMMLLNRFSDLLINQDCYIDCCQKFKFDIISRAYDRKDFSSKEFRKNCGKFRESVFRSNISLYYKLKLYFSCMGFYQLFIFIDNLKKTKKHE